jgi:hypothetical protein
LKRRAASWRQEWIIIAITANEGVTAMLELERPCSLATMRDQVFLNSPVDVATFSSALTTQGWMRENALRLRG